MKYNELVQDILDNGQLKQTRNAKTLSVFGRTVRYDMSEGFPLLTSKKLSFKNIVTELIWFLNGDTNIKYLLVHGCHIWVGDAYQNYKKYASNLEEPDMSVHVEDVENSKVRILTESEFIDRIKSNPEFAKKWGELGPIYGFSWRHWQTRNGEVGEENEDGTLPIIWDEIDQIQNAIDLLKNDPNSRRILVNAWNPSDIGKAVLPPCHYSFQFYTDSTSDGKPRLSILTNMRSTDVGLGLPYNLASYALLLKLFCKLLDMVAGEVVINMGDCHIYEQHIEPLKEQISREPIPLPSVLIDDSIPENLKGLEHWQIKLFDYNPHPAVQMELFN